MNIRQANTLKLIELKFHNVDVMSDIERTGFVCIRFDNGETHLYTKESFVVTVGLRGKITFLMADRCFNNKQSNIVIAHLASNKLNKRFYKKVRF